MTAEDWVWQLCADRDLGYVRGHMGAMLFTGDDGKKRLSALSGGETSRLVFTRLGIERPNVLVLDEPTNHLDLESIEALVEGLQTYEGTLIFVSHDRWFVSQLATRIVEIRADGITDYPGTYEEYVHACGDDHLDVDRVVLKAKQEKKDKPEKSAPKTGAPRSPGAKSQLRKLGARLELVTAEIEASEGRVAEIDATFCDPEFYAATPPEKIRAMELERGTLQQRLITLMAEWETLESNLAGLQDG
jgi:energy-coupling factor transporter ATP-binding protein EcfA2